MGGSITVGRFELVTNVGPWSGAAMHPIEHSIWFIAVFVLLLVPSHPLHAIFLMQLQAIAAVTSHCGYESLLIGKRAKFRLGDFSHQLHYRFYDCNYGTFRRPGTIGLILTTTVAPKAMTGLSSGVKIRPRLNIDAI
jgi:hypothetical protein